MSIQTVTHINFRGQARAALAFYQDVFQGDAKMFTYAEFGQVQHPDDAGRIIWGQVVSASGFHVMAYDVPAHLPWQQGENAYFVSVRGSSAEEITGFFGKLAEEGEVVHRLAPAQWAPLYGMVKDRFGVVWVLDVASQQAA